MRILIAEANQAMQERIEALLHDFREIEVVGFADNGKIAIKKTEELNPDIVLVDLFLPVVDGLNTTKIISQCFKKTKILLLSDLEAEQKRYLYEATIAGARGYLLKKNLAEHLIKALKTIYRGSLYLNSAIEDVSDFLPDPQNFDLTCLNYWLAREALFQWRKQPIGETVSVVEILADLGIEPDSNDSEIINFLERTSNHVSLISSLSTKIENLQLKQNSDEGVYCQLKLQQAVKEVENWFKYTDNNNFATSLKELQVNVKFLRTVGLTKICNLMTKLWQKAGTEPLLNFLQKLQNSLQNVADKYAKIRRDYLYKSNSARRAYNRLAAKLDTDKNKRQENWNSAWNAIKLTYQFKIKAEIYFSASRLIAQLIYQIQVYYQALLDTNQLLINLQTWFDKQNSFEPALLPSLLVHLDNEVNFYELRNQFERQIGHFLNQWGTAASISEELLREKIIIFLRPIAIQLYLNSCSQALSHSFLN